LQHLAMLGALGGNARLGAQLLGYVNRRFDDLGLKRETTEGWEYGKLTATLRNEFGDVELGALDQQGAAWSEDQAVEAALGA